MKYPAGVRFPLFLFFILFFTNSFCQTNFSEKINGWKTQFPKKETIAYSNKVIVTFELNDKAGENDPKVKAHVVNEITVVPVKDFIKFEDGLFYNDEISIDNLKVINPDGKEVAAQKQCMSYSEENIFHSDTKLCIVKFPLAEKGKVFKYTYQENYRDIKFLTSFYFNEQLPAVEKSIEFKIPSWLELDLREFNFTGNQIEKTTSKETDITKITYSYKNVAAYERESHAPNHAISFPHIVLVSKAYTANGQRNVLFESVKNLYGWYSTVCKDIGNKPEDLKPIVAELTRDKKTDLEKIESVFYWVQDHIRYIAFENGIMGFKPDAAQSVYSKKYGDCKGKANLLKQMLTVAGYDARLTWIGTSDLPYDYSLPSLCVDNHMICTVILNGKRYFLDGTEEFIALNDYAQRLQGKQVLIEDGNNFIIDKIPDFTADRNKVKQSIKLNIEDTKLTGNSSVEYNGEAKIKVQSIYSSVRNENKTELFSNYLRKGNDNVIVSNIKNPDFVNRQKPLQVSFDLAANNQVTKAGNELYVVMDWDKDFSNMEFDEDRKNDYEFDHKYHYTVQSELNIPAGYKVEYLPAAFKKLTPAYSFEGSYSNKGKTIVYTKTIVINKPILRKSEFNEWNSFIKDINKFYNDQLVLTK
jgi:transglutaminase-like putative cysteine protease